MFFNVLVFKTRSDPFLALNVWHFLNNEISPLVKWPYLTASVHNKQALYKYGCLLSEMFQHENKNFQTRHLEDLFDDQNFVAAQPMRGYKETFK